MKLALLGSSPIALEAALRFHAHEAALTWFCDEEPVIEALFKSVSGSWEDYTSELGWKTLLDAGARPFEKSEFSWERWSTNYYRPLVEFLSTVQSVKPYKVLEVTKRFLASEEEIPGKSRFFDLFRVIYQLNPEEFIHQQKETNPETYERLSEEFLQSLQSSLEMYEDFDLVIDLRRPLLPSSIAVTGRALGEGRVSEDHVFGGLRALVHTPSSETRELAIVGSGDLAAEALIRLGPWLKDPRHRVFVVSSESDPFSGFLNGARKEARDQLQEVIANMENEFRLEGKDFHQLLREWQELDDFIQVKKPRPAEPIPRLVFFSGHNVTAIDQLVDKRRLFVTLERPEWREGIRQPENNHLDLKTIGVDEVFVLNGLKKNSVTGTLKGGEVGLFEYSPARPLKKNPWKEDLDALAGIEEEIFKLFSPAGPR